MILSREYSLQREPEHVEAICLTSFVKVLQIFITWLTFNGRHSKKQVIMAAHLVTVSFISYNATFCNNVQRLLDNCIIHWLRNFHNADIMLAINYWRHVFILTF